MRSNTPSQNHRLRLESVIRISTRLALKGLSAHDCRHYCASQAAKNQTRLPELQDAGGWNIVAMPMRSVKKLQVASVRRRK